MKKLRLVAIAAILFFSASAFTKASNSLKFNPALWHLKSNQTDASVASNYELASGADPYSCGGTNTICEITAEPSGGSPEQPNLSNGNPASNPEDYNASFRP